MATSRSARRRTLAAQILTIQSAILVVTLAAGFLLIVSYQRNELDHQYEQRALAVAQSTASSASLQRDVAGGDPGGVVQRLAMAVMRSTKVRYVVVTNARGIRYSHPDPALIGQPVTDDPEPASSEPFRTGRPWMGIQRGTLGVTARGKAPLFGPGHRLIGEVSVGIPIATVSSTLAASLVKLGGYLLAALAFGALLSMALSRRLKRQTFGLELDEIAELLQEREAMLRGIREGLLGIDTRGRVLIVNDQARRLLSLPVGIRGRPICDLLPEGTLRDVVLGVVDAPDQFVVVNDRILVANRMPIRVNHRDHLGWVVTFQDRTESEALLRELDTVGGLAEALRAQSHEFSNRLHTVVGLVQLGRHDEAVAYATDVSSARNELADHLLASIDEPEVAALLLGKSSVAGERGIELRVVTDGRLAIRGAAVADVLRLLGNLIDNALDAAAASAAVASSMPAAAAAVPATATAPDTEAGQAGAVGQAGQGGQAFVEVRLGSDGPDLLLAVRDSGAGVPEDEREAIFADGWSTKATATGAKRGLGLALVRQIVTRYRGSVEVSGGPGAVFTVCLPGLATEVPRHVPEPVGEGGTR